MNRRHFLLLTATGIPAFGQEAAATDLAARLEVIRAKHGVPALTAGVVTTDGLAKSAAVGMRKAGGKTAVTNADLWHYGSNTKAMTAMLLGTFVAAGKLKWDALLTDLIPDVMRGAPAAAKKITLRHLLTHRSGLPANADHWGEKPRDRSKTVQAELKRDLLSEPGTVFLYSNLGYVVAGVVAEKLGGGLWEKVIEDRLFKPLGMKMGFGGTGTRGREDQPWPHGDDGLPKSRNGPEADNPPPLGPAGTGHGSLADYAKFLADHLRGAAGKKALLPQSLYTDLATPHAGADYALGWITAPREWAGGTALSHAGSNTMNYVLTWMAPAKGFAVVACCNQGGSKATAACNKACDMLIVGQR